MIPGPHTKANSSENDAERLAQELELELIHKRATWKQAGARYRSIRAIAFLLLFVLIVACLFGSFFVFSRVNEERASPHTTATPTVPSR
jgi:hypothetical protein